LEAKVNLREELADPVSTLALVVIGAGALAALLFDRACLQRR
jgi:hypothetical protein